MFCTTFLAAWEDFQVMKSASPHGSRRQWWKDICNVNTRILQVHSVRGVPFPFPQCTQPSSQPRLSLPPFSTVLPPSSTLKSRGSDSQTLDAACVGIFLKNSFQASHFFFLSSERLGASDSCFQAFIYEYEWWTLFFFLFFPSMKANSLMQLLAASRGLQKNSKHPKSQSKIWVLPR